MLEATQSVLSSGTSSTYLTDVSQKDKPWDERRSEAEWVKSLYKGTEFDKYGDRMADCSRWLEMALLPGDDGELAFKLRNSFFCRVRHCPVCQWRRSLMWRARFFKVLPRILQDYPGHRFIFLTLTVKNCSLEALRTTLEGMNKAWVRLTKRKGFPALGWLKSVEVTRSKDGDAHPHFHCVLLVKPSYFKTGYLSQAKWTDLWKDCLRVDYTPIVHVQAVKPKKRTQLPTTVDEPVNPVAEAMDAMMDAITETLKYTVKPGDLIGVDEYGAVDESKEAIAKNRAWLEELTKQLHKTRAIGIGGVFKTYLSEEDPEDLIHAEGEDPNALEEFDSWLFTWREMVKRYAKKN